MGSKKDNKKPRESTPPPTPETATTVATEPLPEDGPDTPSTVAHEKLTVKSLFAAYETANAALTEQKAKFEEAANNRSRAVKAIFDATGSKGPFKYKGNIVTIVSRTTKGKNEEPHTTYFFKGGISDVVEID